MRKLGMDELDRKSVNAFRESEKTPIVVVLDNIRSMHNVGSVFRTADAFLIQAIYLCGYTPQPPHRDIHKTALGATETVEWKYFASAAEAVRDLRAAGFGVYAVEQTEGSVPLPEFSALRSQGLSGRFSGPLAVVFGNEVSGVGEEALALCDGGIEIPQWGMKHSLNISIAAGIVLWELVRTRQEPNNAADGADKKEL
ncbi:MAG TPA: RNA methyltransferase [Puia sp.]|jgi:23S rRNA (guanosine2251-2'-O)-methyltransferase|nr:RNA methyltransferase [Puia sp.]